jgi:hypothetical protein
MAPRRSPQARRPAGLRGVLSCKWTPRRRLTILQCQKCPRSSSSCGMCHRLLVILSEAKNLAYLRSFADQRRPSVDGARSVPVRMIEMIFRNRNKITPCFSLINLGTVPFCGGELIFYPPHSPRLNDLNFGSNQTPVHRQNLLNIYKVNCVYMIHFNPGLEKSMRFSLEKCLSLSENLDKQRSNFSTPPAPIIMLGNQVASFHVLDKQPSIACACCNYNNRLLRVIR